MQAAITTALGIQLTASDVRQWCYCPRVPYFTYVVPVLKKPTFKMEHGKKQHRSVEALEKRRVLKRYGLERAERIFNLYLTSARRGLLGVIDMVLRDGDYYYPVEFKHSRRDYFINHKMQLMIYAVLLEEVLEAVVPYGFIHNSWTGRTYKIDFTEALRAEMEAGLISLRQMIQTERMPEPTPHRAKCTDCEFRNFCGDVV
jgi:CRISPR-associated exonuclease Cas4